jgi:Ala-tRNA(Pro) deacylase
MLVASMDERLDAFLAANGISYILHTHAPVFTVAEAAQERGQIPGLQCKNLFLKDELGRYYLVVLPAVKRLDMKRFKRIAGAGDIRFGNDVELKSALGLMRGAVSPFGLINDVGAEVNLYVDRVVWDADTVSFHPNTNDQTLELSREMFHNFLDSLKQKPVILAF